MKALPDLPRGFLSAGINAGIKNAKRDFGVIVSEHDATFWATLTTNRSRAHSIERTDAIRSRAGTVRAVVSCSGNANALTGPRGREDDAKMAQAIAEGVGIDAHEVLTASTGVIGHRLPVEKLVESTPRLLENLSAEPVNFAESILTTDRVIKVGHREIFIEGQRVRIHAMVKGAGMIAPEMATMLAFVTTDAALTHGAIKLSTESAIETSFNQICVDGDMSTNDALFVMANGAAMSEPLEPSDAGLKIFTDALTDLLKEMARAIVKDGEGATRMFEMAVTGARNFAEARALSLSVVSSSLVKSAIFGADPYAWGRIISALGAAAAYTQAAFDPAKLRLSLQGTVVFEKGEPVDTPDPVLKHRMAEPEIKVLAELGEGAASGEAWGCDLTYDYVKINADYAAVTKTNDDGSVSVDERLSEFGPTIKKKLLIEALRYIDRFNGLRAVIKLGGAAMVDPKLEEQFAEDVLLLQSVGLKPIVVHGGGPEISRTLDRLGMKTQFIDGLRVTDEASMSVVEMVLTGSVNQRIVAALNRRGGQGVGLSGKDGALIRARPIASDHDYGHVGEVVSVDVRLIEMLEDDDRIPVVSPVGLGDDGSAFNINADLVASALAVKLGARKLIYMSDVAGLLDEDEQVISELTADQLKARIDRGSIGGGMLPKVRACLEALAGGVRSAHLVDGRVPHNVIAELFTDRGVGTWIHRQEVR